MAQWLCPMAGKVLIIGGKDENDTALAATTWFEPKAPIIPSHPRIVLHPESQLLTPGDSASFRTEAKGIGPFHFQWFMNGNPIPGACQPTFTMNKVTASHHGAQFTVRVSSPHGSAMSQAATLTLKLPPPVIFEFKAVTPLVPHNGFATLAWRTSGVNQVRIEGDPKPLYSGGNGCITTEWVTKDTTYTLTATNPTGQSVSAQVTVRLASLTAAPSKIALGGTAYLTPQFPFGQGFIPGLGPVTDGMSLPVSPRFTTTYTLEITPDGKKCICHATVNPSPDKINLEGSHDAIPLENGKALLVGKCAEIFDPETLTFRPAGAMQSCMEGRSATRLLDGRVLIAGGKVFLSNSDDDITDKAEIYDPKTDTFSPTGSLKHRRHNHTATLLEDGMVLIAGDRPAELFDPATQCFTVLPEEDPEALRRSNAVRLKDGKVLLTGGIYAWIYDHSSRTFRKITENYLPKILAITLLPSGKALLLAERKEVIIYDPATEQFRKIAFGNSYWYGSTAPLLPNGNVLITGGECMFDEKTETFHPVNLPEDVPTSVATVLQNRYLLLSGRGKSTAFIDINTL